MHSTQQSAGTAPANEELGDVGQQRAIEALRTYWGYDQFRPLQLEIISSIMARRDVLAVLPTGGGKSLCYQVPALLGVGLTLVVSPLISLMEDQVGALVARGIPAWCLSGEKTPDEISSVWASAEKARAGLLYVSPERLASRRFLEKLDALPVHLLAVDEAHCISEWGHEFRPSYRTIPDVYDRINRPPVLALTATATPRVMSDIAECLDLSSPVRFSGNIDRPNIIFSVLRTSAKRRKVDEILNRIHGSAIVYAPTRVAVEKWAARLIESRWSANKYHGGIDGKERMRAQREWQQGHVRIMVATNAFGMGIDKPDVRSVTHVGLPLSLEGYFQEAGRAGRDGRKAYATLLFDQDDVQRHRELARRENGPIRSRIRRLVDPRRLFEARPTEHQSSRQIRDVVAFALSTSCRRRRLLGHFGSYTMADCQSCDICMGRHTRIVPEPKREEAARAILRALRTGNLLYVPGGFEVLPEYRASELIAWMVRHAYLETGNDPAAPPRVTALGLRMIRPAETECPEYDRTTRRTA